MDSYSIDENNSFKLPITVTGVGPFKFQLIQSADVALFKLDAATGELSSKAPFDFETPQSVSQTNTYALSVLVTDSKNQSVTKDITLNVNNVDEHELVVDFPIDGANMGAAASKVHVRGHITESGKKLAQIPAAFSVEVNGVVATVDPARPSMWVAEVPLTEPVNSLSVSLKGSAKVQREKTIVLENNPVAGTRVADGVNDFAIEVDFSGRKIYKRSLSDANINSLVLSSAREGFESCGLFSKLALSKTSQQFAAMCGLYGQEVGAIIYCNLKDNACHKVGVADTSYSGFIKWADDRHLIFSASKTSIGLLDTNTGVVKTLMLEPGFIFNFSANVDADKDQVYLFLEKLENNVGYAIYYSFSLQPYIENAETQQTVILNPIQIAADNSSNFFSFNGAFYSPSLGGLNVKKLADGSRSFLTIDLLRTDTPYSPTLLHAANGILVFEQDGALFSYDIEANKSKNLEPKKYLAGRFETDISPDYKRLALFESIDRKFSIYDLDTGEARNFDAFSQPANENGNGFGSIAMDWQNNLIYRSLTLDWGGVPSSSSTAVIVAYDTETKAYKTVLTSAQLANHINRPSQRVSPRRITYNAAKQELLFHVVSYNWPGSEQFICTLNVSTGAMKTLRAFPLTNQMGGIDLSEFFMSRLNPALNGIAFAHWGDLDDKGGGVEWYGFDGSLTSLLLPQQPYYLTTRGVMSPKGDRYYGAGYKRPPGPAVAHNNRGEVFFIDMATKNRTVIASGSQGLGLMPPWLEPMYDANHDILVDFTGRDLWFIDTVTGDRVVKPIELPSKSNQ